MFRRRLGISAVTLGLLQLACEQASNDSATPSQPAPSVTLTTPGGETALPSAPSPGAASTNPVSSPGAVSTPSSGSSDPNGAGGTTGSGGRSGEGGEQSEQGGAGPSPVAVPSAMNSAGAPNPAAGGTPPVPPAAGGSSSDPSPSPSPTLPPDPSPRPTIVAEPGTTLVRIDVAERHQTFEGWGTSLCWWANHVGGWDPAARDAVVEAVVDPVAGLGYNIFRYNIGGGENPSHDHMSPFREMPGFQDADGTWRWDNDANQRGVLLSIAERGEDLIFEAFSNSPPYWMTASGCAAGNTDGSNNLREDSYDAFADYLTEVVRHYRDEHGVSFRTLEPLNEPNANWWREENNQEGCHFSPSNQERIILATAQSLESKALDTKISASDENSMDEALQNLGGFAAETMAVIDQLNVHSYAGSRRRELRELADRVGKRLWQSESGPLGQDISGDMEVAMFMAERIIVDLRELEAEAWLDWQSGDPARNWASFTLDDTEQSFSPLKRFYMHAGFSRFIRPGAVIVDVDDANMVAAWSADQSTLSLVVVNGDSSQSRDYTFDLTSLPRVGSSAQVHRTSRDEDLASLPNLAIAGYRLVASVPAYSITTFVVPLQ